MEEISIKNFVMRTPHIVTLGDVHLLAVYIYASCAGVYNTDDREKRLLPFCSSDEERIVRARLAEEAFRLCRNMGVSYTEEMSKGLKLFFGMSDDEKRNVINRIF